MLRLFAAALFLLLAGCGGGLDPAETRTCRLVLPALNPGAAIAILDTRDGHFPSAVRIDYRAVAADGERVDRFVICRFASQRDARGVREFTGLATEAGPFADASFYFLRRFYLESRDDPPLDPAPPGLGDGLAEWPFWAAYAAQHLLAAAPSAAIYALLAAAYAMIYGLIGRIVLVFGEFAALGSLAGVVGLAAVMSLGDQTALAGLLVALVIGVVSAALHGFALSRLALLKLARAPGLNVLIATVGAGLALTEYLRLMQGAEQRWLPPVFNAPTPVVRSGDFVATATGAGLLSAGAGALAVLALILFMRRSHYGRIWRAASDDPKAAALFGVDETRVYDRALVIAAALAGLAGVIMTALYGGMGFAGGFQLGLKALIAAILGGIGSVPGAAMGGLAVATFEALWSATMPIEARDLVIFLALVLVLALRPGGFAGHAEGGPRQI